MRLHARRRATRSALAAAVTVFAPITAAAQTVTIAYDSTSLAVFGAPERTLVDSITQATLREVAAVLPGLPGRVTLRVSAGPNVIDVTGEVGAAIEPGVVGWTVNPAHPGGVLGVTRASLRHTLFHELHHLVRRWTFSGGVPPRSVLDAAIAEGLASVFARDFGGHDAPWVQPPDSVRQWFDELLALPPAALLMYQQWMFQHPDGRRWIGYRTGAWIVDRAITRSGRTSVDLVRTPPAEVLQLAGLTAK